MYLLMLCSAITAVTLSSINFFQDLLKQEQESLGMCVLVFSCTYPQKKFSLKKVFFKNNIHYHTQQNGALFCGLSTTVF